MVELLGSSAEDHAEEIAEIVEFEALVANYSETQVKNDFFKKICRKLHKFSNCRAT